ncbi:MAG: RsmG family class I SAM-dependent methyltransferase, partial [Steroidobacter sp.]
VVQHVVETIGLKNVSILHTRAETYRPDQLFDCVVSRALSSLENFVGWCGQLCAPDGKLLAMKGRYPEDELKSLPKHWKAVAVHSIRVAGLDEQRHLVELCAAGNKNAKV